VRNARAGVEAVYVAASGEVVGVRARAAIFALPRFLVPRLVADGRGSAAELTYGAWMVANLTLRDRPPGRGFPLCWDNVLYDSPSLGYIVATHQSGRDHGATVFTYYRPFTGADPRRDRERLLATSWEDWVRGILADLRPAHPTIEDLVERIDVQLWGHAMVRPRPGLLWSQALADAARPQGAVHFAHTDLSGMALFEEAHDWGVRAALRAGPRPSSSARPSPRDRPGSASPSA
jgi:hypothetical protein